MKESEYRKKIYVIRKEILEKIYKIFDKHQEDGELSLMHNDEGIDLDYVRGREYSWEQYNDEILTMDKDGELYTEDNRDLDLHDFDTCELLKFYEELVEIYGEQ